MAEARGVNAADLARSIILILPRDAIEAAPDPGDPDREDRETITLKSGPDEGKPWKRKPRLQVRLPAGYDPILLRKALGLALSLDQGEQRLTLESARNPTREVEAARIKAEAAQAHEKAARLMAAVQVLAGERLPHAVRTRDEALFVLGFPPGARPDASAIKSRYRQLATVHHPDSDTGDTSRMAQLNQAMSFMRGYIKN